MDTNKKMWIITITLLLITALYQILFPLPPQTLLIRFFALAGFFLLCITLMIGPLALFSQAKFGALIKSRKTTGILAFVFVALHFILVFVYSYELSIEPMLYLPILIWAVPATILLLILTITSSNKIMCKMGFSKWKLLQRTTYIAFAFSFIHFILNTNGLFIKLQNGTTFLNLFELIAIILGLITILMQLTGFAFKLGKKQKETEEKTATKTCEIK
jgi:DMSO/TMAO reductase YedYZ heme-binding membrane subunit